MIGDFQVYSLESDRQSTTAQTESQPHALRIRAWRHGICGRTANRMRYRSWLCESGFEQIVAAAPNFLFPPASHKPALASNMLETGSWEAAVGWRYFVAGVHVALSTSQVPVWQLGGISWV